MHNEAQIILQQVFNKRTLNEVSISELKELTEQYPYFNAAQFLLAKKSRQQQIENSTSKHPSLFFHNPLWFNFLMKQDMITTEEIVEDELVIESISLTTDSESSEETEQLNNAEGHVGNFGEFDSVETADFEEKSEIPGQSEEVTSTGTLQEEEEINFNRTLQEDEVNLKSTVKEKEESKLDLKNDEFDHTPENDQQYKEDEDDKPLEPLKINFQNEENGNSLEFEPFHTIDYFASQGIKLQQADLSRDKFGQQLKSFTEWLKSMKKIPPSSPDDTSDPVVQEQVVQFAQVSNETKEIITETMAEVWSLQGNRQKAIDIYKKLSLLNPAKSAYFASKIDKLNS